MKNCQHIRSLIIIGVFLFFLTNVYGQIVHIDKVVDKKGVIKQVTNLNVNIYIYKIQDSTDGTIYMSLPTHNSGMEGDEVEYREIGNGQCEVKHVKGKGGK